MSRCDTCKLLDKHLVGFETEYCPKCQKLAQTVQLKNEVKAVTEPKKSAFEALMAKAAVKKANLLVVNCPCAHIKDETCTGTIPCDKCKDCIPF